jgi:hypothetical protein
MTDLISSNRPDQEIRHQNTRILHVAVPEDIFNEAKIQAIRQNLNWHQYVVNLLRNATEKSQEAIPDSSVIHKEDEQGPGTSVDKSAETP